MHRVVKSHLADFSSKYSLEREESRQFEAFLNYSVLRSLCAETVDPADLIYDGDDPGIDGIMVFLDDVFVSSEDEIAEFFSSRKRDVDATVVFTQAKTSESWDKKEINAFQSATIDFLADTHAYPHSEFMALSKELFSGVIQNVGKL